MRRSSGICVVVTLLAALTALAGCGSESEPKAQPRDPEDAWKVAADPNATADEIIDAGSPASVATNGEQTLVTYRVESDDDEGPQQGAWRLYDDQGKPIADDRLGQVHEQGAVAQVFPTDDGFLLESYTNPALVHIAPDGTTKPVRVVTKPRPVQAGDLLVQGSVDGSAVFRPADHTAYLLPKLPTDQPQQIAIDDEGVVWVVLTWTNDHVKLAFSPGGTGPWTRDRISAGKGGYPVSEILTGSGQLALVTGHGGDEYPVLDSIWTRPAGPGKVAWQSSPLTGLDGLKALSLRMQPLPDGRLLMGGDGEGVWIQQSSGDFAKLSVPKSVGFYYGVTATGDRLFTTHTQSGVFLVSDDEGKTWDEFKR